MAQPALVFLCQRLPYPPNKGERITTFNLLRHLTRDYRVFVGTFVDDPADRAAIPKLREMVEDLYVDEVRVPWAYVRAFPRWLVGEPISFALFRSAALARWLSEVEKKHRPVAIVTHSSNISAYAVDNFHRGLELQPRRVLDFADVDSEKFVAYAARAKGFRKWIFAAEARRIRREERRLTAGADVVAFVSDEEADLFRSILEAYHDRVVTLPNGVDSRLFARERYPEAPFCSQGETFIFTGAMDYPPNVDAATWFARRVFPKIRDVLPRAQFLIVGSKPTRDVQRLAREPSVVVTGQVESAAAYLAHAQVAVAPLRIARGIQNKVLEAMAMALPVVVTKEAMTGIAANPGEHLICAEKANEWIQACIHLVQDREQARRLGYSARQLVLDRYNWEAQFSRLDRLLNSNRRPRC